MKLFTFTLFLTAVVPIFAQSSAPSPKLPGVTATAIQKQSDVVLDKKRDTEALADQVIAWYEINPKHPGAIEKAQEFHGSYKSLLAENITLLDMLRDYRIQSSGDGSASTLLTLSTRVTEVANHSAIDNKMGQLEVMGFDPSTGRFKAADSVVSNGNPPNAGNFWAALTSKLSVVFAAWF